MTKSTSSIGEIARINFNTISVFQKYCIDFYCKGKNTLAEACALSRCNEKIVAEELQAALSRDVDDDKNFNSWTSERLMDHIVKSHHLYVNNHVPEISALTKAIWESQEIYDFNFRRIKDLFSQLGNDMKQHMQKEEMALFPYIKRLEIIQNEGQPLTGETTVKSLISVVEFEHDTSGIIIGQLNQLCRNYSIPENASPLFCSLFNKLCEFEADLIMHIHLENNVLHKKALELEQFLAN
jgi:regulator of cell morphogenesis and NO signaling